MTFVRRHRVLAFFLLAYALTWGALPWNSFFVPGALIAALVVAAVTEGRAGLRAIGARVIRWRVGWVWWVAALAVPLAVHLVTASANVALGAAPPATDQLVPWYGIPLAIGLTIVNPTSGPFGEEPSFRGYALPSLQAHRTPLTSAAILAAAVTGWHAPLFLMDSFDLHPVHVLSTLAVTFWYVWLFGHASGSALITLVAHATEGAVDTETLFTTAADAVRQQWLYAIVWLLVAVTLLLVDRRFWNRPAPPVAVHPDPQARPSRSAPSEPTPSLVPPRRSTS